MKTKMKQRTIARLVGVALAGMALTAGAATVTVVKPTPLALVISPTPGQTPKITGGVDYGLNLGIRGLASGYATWAVIQGAVISANGVCSNPSLAASGSFFVMIKGAGTCTVGASINTFDSTGKTVQGSAQYTFQVPKRDMSFAEDTPPLPATAAIDHVGSYYVKTSYNPFNASPRLSITSLTPEVCSVQITKATGMGTLIATYEFKALAAGTCTISYSTPDTNDFGSFSTTKTVIVGGGEKPPVAAKTDQKLTFDPVTSVPAVGLSTTLSATGGDSGNAVTFSSKTPEVCKVEGNTLTALAAGACIVAADQDGNDKYNAAPQQSQTLTVLAAGDPGTTPGSTPVSDPGSTPSGKTAQSLTLNALPPSLEIGGTANLTASGGDSGNAVTFSSLTPAVCTVEGSVLTAIAEGTCNVQAEQKGNDQYADATPQSQTLTVQPATSPTSDPGTVPSSGPEVTPFSVNISAAGDITAQTITASITPTSTDVGQNGSEFLAAQLGELTFLYGAGGWVQYTGPDSVVALSSGALANHEVTLLDNIDMTPLLGAQVIVGYGLGNSLAEAYAEMLKASRVMSVYKVE
jgi:hypothetical protein